MKILLIGDSLIEFFDWNRRFPAYRVVNQGIAGETVGGLLSRLPKVLSSVKDIDVVHVMIGTNNVVMDDYAILGDYQDILGLLQEMMPEAKVVLASLLPMRLPWLAPDAISRLNVLLRKMAIRCRVDYLDIYDEFVSGMASGRDFFSDDGVHLNEKGYEIWALQFEKYLQEE